MKFFTLMIITINIEGYGEMHSTLVYPSQRACGEALPAVYETIRPHYPNSGAQCHVTPQPSASLRPKARPEGLKQ